MITLYTTIFVPSSDGDTYSHYLVLGKSVLFFVKQLAFRSASELQVLLAQRISTPSNEF